MYGLIATIAMLPAAASDFLTEVGNGITAVIGWVGTVLTALLDSTGALYPLLPLFAITIAVSAILLGVKIIRGIIWGA